MDDCTERGGLATPFSEMVGESVDTGGSEPSEDCGRPPHGHRSGGGDRSTDDEATR